MKKLAWVLLLGLLLSGCGKQEDLPIPETTMLSAAESMVPTEKTEPVPEEPSEPGPTSIVMTFAGDCTLGSHTAHTRAGYGFLMTVGEDYTYPFAYVKEWFESDDLTLVNLEGTLTDKGGPSGQKYSFRGPEAYVNILTENSIEAVSFSNNHAYDYGQTGYDATKAVLEENGVSYVEQNSSSVITLENGITVGLYATVYNSIDEKAMVEGIAALKEQGVDIIIYAPHWGTEHSFRPTADQVRLGQAAIDAGANIVYGCHPHVLQPIEEYGDGVIYYSLGNFCFGGNIYPSDYDSAIIQQEILLNTDGTVAMGQRTIVPCSISSMEKRNNYQPIPYEAGTEEYDRVLSKLDGTYKGANLPIH